MLKEFLTPEILGAIKTIGGFVGLDLITGSINNKFIGRASVVLKCAQTCFNAISVLATGASGLIQKIQDYGNEKIN